MSDDLAAKEAGAAKATDEATPSRRDAAHVLRDVDALVQSETRATEIILHMVGNALAQIAAKKPPCRQPDIQSLAVVTRDCAMRIAQLRDLVNGEAEAVGCNWTDSAGECAVGD